MGVRCTVRLPDALHDRLQRAAEARRCGVSDVIREALERLLGSASDNGAEPPRAPEPAPLSMSTPHDCAQTVLAVLLPEVRARIVETASLLDMPVLHIIRSLLIAQTWPPGQASPQIPEAALAAAAPPPAAPAPWTSLPTTEART
jgi:Arc/MetJ-type ribon-helix-helix transcriptional regulator